MGSNSPFAHRKLNSNIGHGTSGIFKDNIKDFLFFYSHPFSHPGSEDANNSVFRLRNTVFQTILTNSFGTMPWFSIKPER